MQTISGTIQQVTPPDYSNNFGVQYQNIQVLTVQGPITGRIGTKQPYTNQNIGQQGNWDMESMPVQGGRPAYNKLKKHYDTPYSPQGAPQGPSQAAGTPQGQPSREMHIMRLAVLKAVLSATDIPLDMVNDYLLAGMQFAFTGKWSITPSMPSSATPGPAMGEEDSGDDVPWEG